MRQGWVLRLGRLLVPKSPLAWLWPRRVSSGLALIDAHRWDGCVIELDMCKCRGIVMVLGEVLSGSHFRGRPCLARGLARLSQGADL